MKNPLHTRTFKNADQEPVEYDGSSVTWRVSAYALIQKKQKILVIKNSREKIYDLVGGGIEFGETIAESLKRESLEEGGAEIALKELLHADVNWFYHRENEEYHQTLRLFYRATLLDKLQDPTDEFIEWRGFVPIADVGAKYRLPPVAEKVAATLLSDN